MKLDVRHHGIPDQPLVGSLADDARGRIFFQFDPGWIARGIELSPLRLPLSLTSPVTTPTSEFSPLFGLFDDSMPDWWGQRIMRHHFLPTSAQATYAASGATKASVASMKPLTG